MYMYNCTDILTLLSICTHAGRKCPQPEYSVRPVFGTSPPVPHHTSNQTQVTVTPRCPADKQVSPRSTGSCGPLGSVVR